MPIKYQFISLRLIKLIAPVLVNLNIISSYIVLLKKIIIKMKTNLHHFSLLLYLVYIILSLPRLEADSLRYRNDQIEDPISIPFKECNLNSDCDAYCDNVAAEKRVSNR